MLWGRRVSLPLKKEKNVKHKERERENTRQLIPGSTSYCVYTCTVLYICVQRSADGGYLG